MTPSSPSAAGRPRVVVVGCGFGGLSAAKALGRADVDITLIDRRNYHLFQPLLYQVATAGLSPAEIAQPIRAIVRDQANTSVLLGRVTGVDTAARQVILDDRRVAYDYLILATGARHAYFGHDEWEAVAPGLKKIEDAIDIRRRILLAFERGEMAMDEAERRRLLTFVIVGGGPTGLSSPVRSLNWRIGRWRPISAASIRARRASFWSRRARACCRRSPKRSPPRPRPRSRSLAWRCASARR